MRSRGREGGREGEGEGWGGKERRRGGFTQAGGGLNRGNERYRD